MLAEHGRGPSPWTGLVYLLAALLSAVPGVVWAEDVPADQTFLLVTSPDTAGAPTATELRRHLEAALTPYSIPVLLLESDVLSADAVEVAFGEMNAFGAAWTSPDGCQLTLLIPSAEPAQRIRTITPAAGESRSTRHEILSTILLSELMPVLDDIFGEPPVLATNTDEPAPTEVLPEPARETDEPNRRIAVGLLAMGAYAPAPLTPGGSPLHGGTIAIGVSLGRHLHLTLAAEFVQSSQLDTPAGTASYSRDLARLALYVPVPLGPADLGPVASIALERWSINDLEFVPSDEAALRTHRDPVLGVAVRVRLSLLDGLAPYLEAGIDAFFTRNQITYGEDHLLTRAPVLPHLAIGIAFEQGLP